MNVAIVDDEQKERDLLVEYCQQYAAKSGAKIDTATFLSGDALLRDYKVYFDIIIFDIDMPGTNGMETAKQIRELDKNVVILFMTNIAQYAIDGYAVEAVDYVIKPVGYSEFSMKFQKAMSKAAQKKSHTLIIETVDGVRDVKTSDLWYVEVMSHYLFFHTSGGVYKARGSMKEQMEVLVPYHFCRIHKSYLVNLAHVIEIQAKKVLVETDELPLGRSFKNELMKEYMRYIRG